MRDPNRIDPILQLLRQVWTQKPDWRLGQLIVSAVRPDSPMPSIFHAEDDKVIQGLKAILGDAAKNQDSDGRKPT